MKSSPAPLTALVIIVLAGLAAYSSALPGDFVFDDHKLVENNEDIRSLSNVPGMFAAAFTPSESRVDEPQFLRGYRPVRFASYALDYALAGASPWMYHLSNVVYHAAASFLLFLIALRFVKNGWWALLAGVLFALHPVHTEAVTYVSGRRDVLFTVFYLLGFYLFIRYRERGGWFHVPLVALCYLLGLLSKEMAVTMPAACVLYELVLPREETAGKRTSRLALGGALLAIGIAYTVFEWTMRNPTVSITEQTDYWGGSLFTALLSASRAVWVYARLSVAPFGLSADYSTAAFMPSSGLFTPWTTALAVTGAIGLAALGIYLWKKSPRVSFLLLFFLVSLSPVLQIFPHHERFAERFLYLPSLSFVLLGVMALSGLFTLEYRKIAVLALVAVVGVFGVQTFLRNFDWRDELTLWEATTERFPTCMRAQVALGNACFEKRNTLAARAVEISNRGGEEEASKLSSEAAHYGKRAREAYTACLAVFGENALDELTNRPKGYALMALGKRAELHMMARKYESAIADYRKFFSLKDQDGVPVIEKPAYASLQKNVAIILGGMGKHVEALDEYDRILERTGKRAHNENFRAAYLEALVLRAQLLFAMGRNDEGLKSLETASLAAGRTLEGIENRNHWADALVKTGRPSHATDVLEIGAAIAEEIEQKDGPRFRAQFVKNRYLLGQAMLSLEREPEAMNAFKEAATAVGRTVESLKYRYLYADLLVRLDESEKAASVLREALDVADELERDDKADAESLLDFRRKSLVRLAGAYSNLGKYDPARKAIERTIELDPDFAKAHTAYGYMLLVKGEYEEAMRRFARALELAPEDQESLQGIALCRQALQKKQQPQEPREVKKTGPSPLLAASLVTIGRGNLVKGSNVNAAEDFEKALEIAGKLDPNENTFLIQAEANYLLGVAKIRAGEENASAYAAQVYEYGEKLLRGNPTVTQKASAIELVKKTGALGKDPEKALQVFLGLLDVEDENDFDHLLCEEAALYALDIENHARAELLFRKQLRYDPPPARKATALYHLGYLAFRIENFEKAKKYWKEFLDLEKESDRSGRVKSVMTTHPAFK